jgi:hypothetical protein
MLHVVRPPLWSSGQSCWLQIQRSGFDSRHYQMFCEVVGLEQGPLSLVSTSEELLERKSSGPSLERREYGRSEPSRLPRGTLFPQVGINFADVVSQSVCSLFCYMWSNSRNINNFLQQLVHFSGVCDTSDGRLISKSQWTFAWDIPVSELHTFISSILSLLEVMVITVKHTEKESIWLHIWLLFCSFFFPPNRNEYQKHKNNNVGP